MNCVFTIVAKNYLAMALTLGDSLAKVHPEYDFKIFLADESDETIRGFLSKYQIIEVKDIGIENWKDLAFKYDVSEFSTSIKPFCFEYLVNESNYTNLMYFDPDIYIFNQLSIIEERLRDHFCVITPHASDLEIEWSGAVPEENSLISGVFNLGFIAFRNNDQSRFVFRWWKEKLRRKCYLERLEGLFYDQNWIQFLASSFHEDVCVLKDYGFNVAWWNLHERIVEYQGEIPTILHKGDRTQHKCVFFHFSGFNVLDRTVINSRYRKNPFFVLKHQPDLSRLFNEYADRVVANGHGPLKNLDYKFNHFENGFVVTKLHRRIYKELTSKDIGYRNMDGVRRSLMARIQSIQLIFENPFSTEMGSFYALMNENGLIIKSGKLAIDNLNPDRDGEMYNNKIIMATKIMKFFKKCIGIKNYISILKFLNLYTRDEYQLFLLDLTKHDFRKP